jgi:alcohol dehydrogenase
MLPSYYEFICDVKICSGEKALDNIPAELARLGVSRPMVVTDKGVSDAGLVKPVLKAFAESGITIGAVFDDVPPDSSFEVVKQLADLYREKQCDSLVAVGGGSVLDTAKGADMLITEEVDDLMKLAGVDGPQRRIKPMIAVPTTSGTGSEVTKFAVITEPQSGRKVLFISNFLLPQVAILDPRMTITLPAYLTAATAMDAVTHSMEAYFSLGKNPLSDAYAQASIQMVAENLVPVLKKPKDAEGRLALANAATLAGIAFSNAGVGMVHAMGHSLGSVCHIPHGVAMSILLPHGLEYNMHKIKDQAAELLLPLCGADLFAKTPEEKRAEETVAGIRRLQNELWELAKLPRSLKETGKVEKSHFEDIAKTAQGDGAIVYNPEEMDLDEMMTVLERAWE